MSDPAATAPPRTPLRHEARLFALALQFLTRLPVPASVGFDPHWMQQSVRHFPFVGALVGGVGAAVALGALMLWPPVIAALLAVGATVWLTAAFHEDGLADTADALLGAAPRERALEIMKDSRIGTYGSAALLLTLALRVALLATLLADAPMAGAAALVASHALARAGAVVLMALLPYAGDTDRAKTTTLARAARPRDAPAALTACVPFVAMAAWPGGWWRAGAAVIGIALLLLVMRAWLRRRLGGVTGDTLGAAEQLGEVVVLLAFTAALGMPALW